MINKELLIKQVNRVIEYSQDLENVDCTFLIDKWVEGKNRFISCLGDDLIYEYPNTITIELPEEEKTKQINEFYALIERCAYHTPDMDAYKIISFLRNNEDSLYKNIVTYGTEKINEGMKISKALKFFIPDKEVLDTVQTALSRMIQEEKISGKLCISVHPLDYLSVSENTHNWRSCHALDGDYRAGNLAYMVDTSTIVCYLKTNDVLEKLPHFPYNVPWNSKKWRMLLFVSERGNGLFAGRHYPFFSKSLMDYCKDIYIQKFVDICYDSWSLWHNERKNSIRFKDEGEVDNFSLGDDFIYINEAITPIHDLMTSSPDDLHFNDLLNSSCYKPYYAWQKYPRKKSMFFHIGDRYVPCPKCKEGIVSDTDSMVCGNCDDSYIHCYNCGSRVRENDAVWINSNDYYVCQNCYNDYYGSCDRCGDSYNTEDLTYDETDDAWYCQDCYEEVLERRGEI